MDKVELPDPDDPAFQREVAERTGHSVDAIRHSARFRKVSNRYPHMVAAAYERDLARAMADDDATVAAHVAAYERAQGWAPRDWHAIGRKERDEL